ncbi:hypothetical protein [Actinoplanes awajinensis]|uniref:Uncharacterized protein n=1 Tax=Actinoplanes awajinensis subsp. mycoplanecinus TaxID=135947 RepID=A0A117MN22_9ACTN|nr:hypothetical protein [Actinoplanes awajinensis]KUL26471.1 hypothetical protein ADL15_37905 [Actinoplanes awajinensis subsp. mycoplanecinus]
MAEKGWTAQAGAAAGIAAGAGAAQLGLGYGLGVIEWPVTVTASDSTWLNSLGWATWITASATVLGAVLAGRLRDDRPGRWRALWRFALSASAALGALVSVALVALPARSAVRTDTLSPQLVAVGYALIGLFAGVVVAFWAVSSGPVAANLLGTAAWLWALAVAGVVAELISGRDFATYLTSWQFAESQSPVRYGGIYWPSAALTLVAAFVIGLAMAWPAARRGQLGLGAATSGAVGPLLVAISFLSLAPLLTEAAGPLQSAYLIAPYAVLAGLAGSALTVSIGQARRKRLARNSPDGPDGPLPVPALGAAPAGSAPSSGAPSAEGAAVGVARPTGRVSPRPATAPVPHTPPAGPSPSAPSPSSPSSSLFAAESSKSPATVGSSVSTRKAPTVVESSTSARKTPTPVETSALARKTPTPVESSTPARKTPTPVDSSALARKTPPVVESSALSRNMPTAAESSAETEAAGESPVEAAAPRRRWLFGRRQPVEATPEPTVETTEPEPSGRSRKPRASKNEPAVTGSTATASAATGSAATGSAATGSTATGSAAEKAAAGKASADKPAAAKPTGERPTAKPAARPAARPADKPAPTPTPPPADEGFGDSELAAAARPSKNAAAKRAAIRKDAANRSTITPPPANPTVARINPKD